MKLSLYDRFLKLFGVNITYEWCVVGCLIGRHSWDYRLEKCRNGTPVISGGFLNVIKVQTEEHAKEIYDEFTEKAEKYNKEQGYAP
jgi:hypothetical protein